MSGKNVAREGERHRCYPEWTPAKNLNCLPQLNVILDDNNKTDRSIKTASSSITSVTSKKSPKVYKSCPKMISLEKWNNTFTKIA